MHLNKKERASKLKFFKERKKMILQKREIKHNLTKGKVN